MCFINIYISKNQSNESLPIDQISDITMKITAILFVLCTLLSMISCSSEKPVDSFSTKGHTIYHLEPATVLENNSRAIVAAAYDGTVLCHTQNGKQLWKNKASEGFPFDLVVGDIDNDGLDEAFMASSDGNLYAFDHDGTLLWTFETHPPLYAVDVTYDNEGSAVILTGGIEKVLYALSPKGDIISEYQANGVIRLIGTDKVLNDGKYYAAVASARQGLPGDFTLRLHKIPDLDIVWAKETGDDGRSRNFGRNYSIDFADLNRDGKLEMILGLFFTSSDEVTVIDHKGNKTTMKTCADARMDPYKMNLVTHISSPTLDEEFFLNLSGSDLMVFDNEGNCKDILIGKYGFAGSCFDPETNTYWLGSGISGGDDIYRLDLSKPDWKEDFLNLEPVGKMAQLEENMKLLLEQTLNFEAPIYQPPPSKPLVTFENSPEVIRKEYIEPYELENIRFASYHWFHEVYDREIKNPSPFLLKAWERRHGSVTSKTRTQEELINYAREREKAGENFFLFAGHGRPFGIDFYCQPETYYEMLRAAPNTLQGFVMAELEHFDEYAARDIRDLLIPLADSCYKYGKRKIFLRNKNTFWNAGIYLDLWKPIFSDEKYREIFVPLMEETNSRSQSLSQAGRLGIWMSGMFNYVGGRAVTDNANYNRLWEWGQTKHLSHFIRKLSLNRMLGADYFQVNVYSDNDIEMIPFFLMLEKGILPKVEPEDILSVSGVTVGIKSPDRDFLRLSTNGHDMDNYSPDEGEFVFDRLACYWGGAPLAEHDFERYSMNAIRRLTNFIPQFPYGNMTTISADSDLSKFPWFDKMFVTDGKYWYDEHGEKHTASAYKPTVLNALEEAAKELPIRVNGDVSWVAVRLDEEHVRLVLIDPGYLDPADREAEVLFQHLTPIEVKDILSGESIKVNNNGFNITVPLGILRIIDIKHRH